MCDKKSLENSSIFVNSWEDFQQKTSNLSPRSRQVIKYICIDCGKEAEKGFYRISKELLCRGCSKKRNTKPRTEEEIKAITEKRIETNIKKYGVANPLASKEIRNKIAATNKQKYGNESFSRTDVFKQKVKENWNNKSSKEIEDIQAKQRATMLERYNVENAFQSAQIREKIKASNRQKYGTDWPQSTLKEKQKRQCTCLQKYGVQNYGQSLEARKNRRSRYFYENEYFDSKPELAFWIYCKDNDIKIKRSECTFSYIVDGVEHKCFPDFIVNEKDLVEIKGDHFFNGQTGELINPFDASQNEIYKAKYQCLVSNNVTIKKASDCKVYLDFVESKYSKDFMNLFRTDLEFPWANSDFKDTSDLGIIRHFHKSIYEASKAGYLSPLQAWEDKNIIKKAALNRLKYIGNCKPETVRQGLSVARIAPKISVFKPTTATYLINKYLKGVDVIYDPFSGFSGRLLGAANCNKKYIGSDIHPKHVAESNEIIQYKNLEKTSQVIVSNLLTSEKVHCCEKSALFTCPPYGGKEHWNENNDEIEKSCDEWIDICLEKYDCKLFLFVVDVVEKYKDYIVETFESKKGLFKNCGEKVVLICK